MDPAIENAPIPLPRNVWRQKAESEFDIAKNDGTQLCFLFIDLDRFKDVNDRFGHETGDQVLNEVSALIQLLEGKVRTGPERPEEERDQITINPIGPPDPEYLIAHGIDPEIFEIEGARIGGDEFALICKTDFKGAQIIAQRLRKTFNEYLERPENQRLKEAGIGISIGIGALKPDMENYSELLEVADLDMYKNKREQLPPLTEEQEQFLLNVQDGLEQHKIRQRDIGRYLILLANKD